jgi:hypothetical protein
VLGASLALAALCLTFAAFGAGERVYDAGSRLGASFNEITANSGASDGGGISPLHLGDEPLLP